MSRELTSHRVNGCNEQIKIEVLDAPGAGGASHLYRVTGFDLDSNGSTLFADGPHRDWLDVLFQNGPIPENGTNGVTQEVLLAIVEDRLKSFQAGPYACRENALALTKVQEAMFWLKHRTEARLARGVEGTHTV